MSVRFGLFYACMSESESKKLKLQFSRIQNAMKLRTCAGIQSISSCGFSAKRLPCAVGSQRSWRKLLACGFSPVCVVLQIDYDQHIRAELFSLL